MEPHVRQCCTDCCFVDGTEVRIFFMAVHYVEYYMLPLLNSLVEHKGAIYVERLCRNILFMFFVLFVYLIKL